MPAGMRSRIFGGRWLEEFCPVTSYPCTPFLVADTQLYKRLCPSVRRSVGRSVGPSVRGHESKSEEMSVLEHLVADSCITAPAHPSATDGRVSGLILKSFLL